MPRSHASGVEGGRVVSARGTQCCELRLVIGSGRPATRDGSAVDPSRDAYACQQAKTAAGPLPLAPRDLAGTDCAGTTPLVAQKPYAFGAHARLDGGTLTDPAARLACYRGKIVMRAPSAARLAVWPAIR